MNQATKITPSAQISSILLRGIPFHFDNPVVMAIVNINSDSFHGASRATSLDEILKLTEMHISGGARFIDLGTTSTRPGAALSHATEEIPVLLPAIRAIRKEFPGVFISVDTYHSTVAEVAVAEGADIINDISGGRFDEFMFEKIAALRVPYILMHSVKTPETMQDSPLYKDVLSEVLFDLESKIQKLQHLGVSDIIIDPGFGFGKTNEHNFRLMAGLSNFKLANCPILVGISRKSMITKTLGIKSDEALNGTTALNMYALMNGAAILRVHDALEAFQTIQLFQALNHTESSDI
ncbi:MAG: dihydropteroate synthase [Bacteroidetes bacterium]|nr:dihydropteroate synthase [Bacteroidota bacterium]